jgi:hypothetical protein
MFKTYTDNTLEVENTFQIYDSFYKDFNRCYMRADSFEVNQKFANLDALIDTLAQIAGSREGVHMITRILHQGILAHVVTKNYYKLDSMNISQKQLYKCKYTPAFTVQKINDDIVFIAGVIWRNTAKSFSYNIQKVIVPASKIGNIQSPLDIQTEEYYSPLMANKDDAINQYGQAINGHLQQEENI